MSNHQKPTEADRERIRKQGLTLTAPVIFSTPATQAKPALSIVNAAVATIARIAANKADTGGTHSMAYTKNFEDLVVEIYQSGQVKTKGKAVRLAAEERPDLQADFVRRCEQGRSEWQEKINSLH
jgi:hypothetical protein